jgi:hypothetical protein
MEEFGEEIFNAKRAEKLIRAGYCVRNVDWTKQSYVYYDNFVLYNQDGEMVGWDIIKLEKKQEFEIVYEEEREHSW